jgi:uroporphyrinogen decarboxylase
MTSRERVESALSHREPDRTPMFEYVLLSPIADTLLGRPYLDYAGDRERWVVAARETGWERAVRQYAVDRLDLANRLDHDMLYVVASPPPGRTTESPAQVPPTTDDPVERMKLRNERAAASAGVPPDEAFLVYHVLAEETRRRGIDLPILAPAYAHGVWTDVDLMQTMLLEPDVARQHFSLATRRALALIDKYLDLNVDQIAVGGDFAGNRPIISPQAYRQCIMPEVRSLAQHIHARGGRAINASDGDLWPVIDDFLLGCEVDGYLEIDQQAGMQLRRLKQGYGKQITFYGNMDCGSLLTFGTQDEIRRATLACLEAGAGDGGHVFCASNAITASVPLANYVIMVNAYREFFGLPRLDI